MSFTVPGTEINFRDIPIEHIITSPLKRAKQTGQVIADTKHLPLIEMPQFIERSFGDAEGMTPEEREKTYPDRQYIGQESREAVRARVMDGLSQIQQQYEASSVIVVAHGAVINSILAILSNDEIGSGKTNLTNACISKIVYVEGSWQIESYNEVAHLIERYAKK